MICNGFWWIPEDEMPSQVLASAGAYFEERASHCVGAEMHPAAKGCFLFLFHYFTGAEECTAAARSGHVKSLHGFTAATKSSHCISVRFRPRVGYQKPKPFPKWHTALSFHFLGENMLLFPKSSLSHPFTFLPLILVSHYTGSEVLRPILCFLPSFCFQCFFSALWCAVVLVQGVKSLSTEESVSLLLWHPLPK